MAMSNLINKGIIRNIPPNNARAKSLIEMSVQSLKVITDLNLIEQNSSVIFRELYECLRQTLEATGYRKGLKFENHESLKDFAREKLHNDVLAKDFDRYRKIRNGINCYGDKVAIETARNALKDIPKHIKESSKNF